MGGAPSSPQEEFGEDSMIQLPPEIQLDVPSRGLGGNNSNSNNKIEGYSVEKNASGGNVEEFTGFTLSGGGGGGSGSGTSAQKTAMADTPKGCGATPTAAERPMFERRQRADDDGLASVGNKSLKNGNSSNNHENGGGGGGGVAGLAEGEILTLDSIQATVLEDVDDADGGAVTNDSLVRSSNPSVTVSTSIKVEKAEDKAPRGGDLSPISKDLEDQQQQQLPAPPKLLSHSWHGGEGSDAEGGNQPSYSPHSGKQSFLSSEHRSEGCHEEALDVEDF